jgi:hypothetical protein
MKINKVLILSELKSRKRREIPNAFRIYKAFQFLGYETTFLNHSEFTIQSIKNFDLILSFATLFAPANIQQAKILFDNKSVSSHLALWYFDLCNPNYDSRKFETIKRSLLYVDWLFTTDHSYPWENHIQNYRHLMQGVEPNDFDYNIQPTELRKSEVVFTGAFNHKFPERMRQLELLKLNFSVDVYGIPASTRIYGRDFFEAYQKAKIGFVPAPSAEMSNNYWSNRVYVATATGTPCVVGYVKGLEKHFENNKEVLFYNSDDELIDCVRRLLASPELRNSIGLAGRIRTLTEHTYAERVKYLVKEIESGE